MSADDITHCYRQLAEASWTFRQSLHLTYKPQTWHVLCMNKREITLGVIIKRWVLCAPHIMWRAAKLTLASWREGEGEPRHQFLSESRLTWTSQRHFLLLSRFSASLEYRLPFSSDDKLCYPPMNSHHSPYNTAFQTNLCSCLQLATELDPCPGTTPHSNHFRFDVLALPLRTRAFTTSVPVSQHLDVPLFTYWIEDI